MLVVSTLVPGGPLDIKSSLEYLMTLFPRKVFNDSLPRIAMKHQLYSLHSAKTLVDRQLVSAFIEEVINLRYSNSQTWDPTLKVQ